MADALPDFWLFDLDGTIVDVEQSYPREVFAAVGDRLGHEFTDRDVEHLWYGVGRSRDELLARTDVDPDLFWEAFHEVDDPVARAEATYVYDDAAALLTDLDRPTGVVTHCQSYLTGPILNHLDIGNWFDTVVCCDDEIGWKPDPAPVERAMADLGVGHDGHEGVLVGDNPDDVGAAWNAGLEAVYVNRIDPERRGRCVLGDRRVDSLESLSQ
jgi:phosphoglycolate phosphatase